MPQVLATDDEEYIDEDGVDRNGNCNCIVGMQCPNPKCEKAEGFRIMVTTPMEMFDNGSGDNTAIEYEYEDDAWAECMDCQQQTTVGDLREAYKAIQRRPVVKCPQCDQPIEPGEPVESTPQGSMHPACATEHEEQHPEEW